MKASILSLLITLLVLSVTASAYAYETHTNQIFPSFHYEIGERLNSDLNSEDTEPHDLISQQHYFHISLLLLNSNEITELPSSIFSRHLSIRAPPQQITT